MHNSKLIRILRCLSKRQLSRFGEFVHSPYFNKNTDIISFCEYLLTYGPAFKSKKLDKREVLKKFNQHKKINEQTLAYWMNQVFQLLEQFLSMEKLVADEWQTQKYLIQSYQQFQLGKAAQKVLEKAKKQLKKKPLQNAESYLKTFQLAKTAYDQSSHNKWVFNKKLQIAANELDLYYLVEKLRYCCEMLNLENIINVDYDLQLGNEIIRLLEGHPLAEVPAVSVYLNIVKMLREEDGNEYFQIVNTLLKKHETIFSTEELKDLYTSLLNYCTRRINRFNEEHYWTEYLEINKFLLEKKLLFESGKLSPWRYTNLVNVGLKTRQLEWTRSFIDQYKALLPKEYSENMYLYNSSLMHYHLKNYDKAQQLLIRVETRDVLLNILNRSLLVKIYYETEQTELLLFTLEANRVFLLRNQMIDPKVKKQMKRFIEFTRKLVKIEAFEAEKLKPLMDNLPEAAEILHWEWLSTQIEQKMKAFL